MFKRLRSKDAPQKADPQTGEISLSNYRIAPPDLSHARTAEEVAGKNIQFINLKDHEEMNGKKVAIVHVEVKEGGGEFANKPYVVLGVWLLDDNDNTPLEPKVIMTGAENVLARVLAAEEVINEGTPVIGTFRSHGRAWSLD
jgi:hypothetical protein